MGLGLAVAKRFSIFIGGDITLATFDDGNLFTVNLPLDQGKNISESGWAFYSPIF
jgi:signal transduction histidine kinase